MISILVPTFNEERYIERCLSSILAFQIPNPETIEVLVLDGRSTDRTRELVASFSARDPRISLVDNPRRLQAAGLNIGIARATGEWVMRLDAHTIYPTDYLLACYETAARTGADNVGGRCTTLPGDTSYGATVVQALTTHRFGVGNSGFRTHAPEGRRDTVPFGFFRREVFSRVGVFDERLERAQDYEFNRRIAKQGGTVHFSPTIHSTYYNLPSFAAFLRKQATRQGPFNAYMWFIAPYTFAPRHAVTGAFAMFFWLTGCLSLALRIVAAPFLSVMALYFLLATIAGVQQAIRYSDWRHAIALPPAFFLFHLSHGTGLLTGLVRLALGISPVQRDAAAAR
jgi:glycosyltransferase involved in cell wall biosynthesis